MVILINFTEDYKYRFEDYIEAAKFLKISGLSKETPSKIMAELKEAASNGTAVLDHYVISTPEQ